MIGPSGSCRRSSATFSRWRINAISARRSSSRLARYSLDSFNRLVCLRMVLLISAIHSSFPEVRGVGEPGSSRLRRLTCRKLARNTYSCSYARFNAAMSRGQFPYGAHFDAPDARWRNLGGQLDRFVQILGIDQVKPRELLLRFGKGTIGHRHFAVAHPHGGRRMNRLQGFGRDVMPILPKLLSAGFALTVGDIVELLLFEVYEA